MGTRPLANIARPKQAPMAPKRRSRWRVSGTVLRRGKVNSTENEKNTASGRSVTQSPLNASHQAEVASNAIESAATRQLNSRRKISNHTARDERLRRATGRRPH